MTNTYLDLTPLPAFNSATYTAGTRVLSFGHTKPGTTSTANVTVTLPLGTSSVPGLLQVTEANGLSVASGKIAYTHPTSKQCSAFTDYMPKTGTYSVTAIISVPTPSLP